MRTTSRKFAVLVGAVSVWMGVGLASAADKRISLNTGDTMTLAWRDGWVVGSVPDDAPAGAVVFHGADPKKWRAMLAPLPPHPTLTGDVGNLRIYVRNMARALENGGLEVDPEQKPVDAVTPRGFYVRAHDPNPQLHAKRKDEAYADGYTGAIKVGAKPMVFEIAWNKGGEADANAALAIMKTLRIQ